MTLGEDRGLAPQVLVIEDEQPVRRFLRAGLEGEGFRMLEAATAADGLRLAAHHGPDVVLLDLGLPDQDGLEVLQRLREWSQVPVIVLSARGAEAQKVAALDAGADDYLVKPFSVPELLARVRVSLRHAARVQSEADVSVFELGPLRVDLLRRRVTVDASEVHLTRIEYRMLMTLVRNAGKVVTHRQLLQAVWGPGNEEQTQYLRVHMTHLRRKLERDPLRPRFITTEPGVGYRLRDEYTP